MIFFLIQTAQRIRHWCWSMTHIHFPILFSQKSLPIKIRMYRWIPAFRTLMQPCLPPCESSLTFHFMCGKHTVPPKNKKRKQRKTARLPLKSAQANIRQVLRSIFMSHSSADGLLQNRQPDVLLIPTAGIMVLSSAIRPTEKSKLASPTNRGICAMSAFPIPRSSWTNIWLSKSILTCWNQVPFISMVLI